MSSNSSRSTSYKSVLRDIQKTQGLLAISNLTYQLAAEKENSKRLKRDAKLEEEIEQLQEQLVIEADNDIDATALQRTERNERTETWVGEQASCGAAAADDWISNMNQETDVPGTRSHRATGRMAASPCPLPRTSLESFDGNSLNWPRWSALFKALVHDRKELSDTEKLTFLQANLTGPAREAVNGLFYDGRFYGAALKELREQFGDPAAVVRDNLDKIYRLIRVREHDYVALAELSRTLHASVSVLKSLGYMADIAATTNMTAVISKLPPALAWRWGEWAATMSPDRKPDLMELSQWLKRQVSAARAVYGAAPGFDGWSPSDGDRRREERYEGGRQAGGSRSAIPRTTGTPWTVAAQKSSRQGDCICCSGHHHLENCSVFAGWLLEDRWRVVRRRGACFSCLRIGHYIGACEAEKSCTVDGCQDRHHRLLHGRTETLHDQDRRGGTATDGKTSVSRSWVPSVPPSNTVSPLADHRPTDRDTGPLVGVALLPRRDQVLLQVLPVTVHGPGGSQRVNAMLDLGSQLSLITDELAQQIGLRGFPAQLNIATVARTEAYPSRQVHFHVQSMSSPDIFPVNDAQTTPTLNITGQGLDWPTEKCRWSHLADLNLPAVSSEGIGILLGTDVFDIIVPREIREGPTGSPSAVKTKLGWVVTNRLPGRYRHGGSAGVHVTVVRTPPDCDEALQKQLTYFWSTESFGTKYDEPPRGAPEEIQALAILNSTITYRDGRYSTGLLWRCPNLQLPDNRAGALTRLKHTERKLDRDQNLLHAYSEVIESYIHDGYARRVDTDDIAYQSARPRWYLPHHGVTTPTKPGKIRVVFDAAARFGGTSLNDHLLTGPDLTNSLIGVLLRFRQRPYALCADIQAMYHQVRVAEEDRSALRFLWRGSDRERHPDTYEMTVHVFGAASSSCAVNYTLRRCATDNVLDFPRAAEEVFRSFYVDDYISSFESADEANKMKIELIQLLNRGGFNLTKWIIPHKQHENSTKQNTRDLDFDGQELVRALGVQWNIRDDQFAFKVSNTEQAYTKRGVLSKVSSIFDPLGMISPFTIRAKQLLQRLWLNGYDWDQEIDNPAILNNWLEWQQELDDLDTFALPRCYRPVTVPAPISSQLHVFCDASETGFGAVAYLRLKLKDGQIVCSFVMSRCRVAPLRQLTIPRLELQGAVMAVRLADTIRKELDITVDSSRYWTDSKTVLRWINSASRRFHTFVANRVAEIQDSSDAQSWGHVAGSANPADVVSRGCRAESLCDLSLPWFRGPNFLYHPEENWPIQPTVEDESDVTEERVVVAATGLTNNPILRPDEFSAWLKLLRVTAWVSRFLHNCRALNGEKIVSRSLTAPEIRKAELLWIKQAQTDAFRAEVEALAAKTPLPRRSPLLPLNPRLDGEGMLRVGGRLERAQLPYECRHQLLLPSSHDVTRLLVTDMHRRLAHSGPEHVLCSLRQRFWILHGRSTVKRWTAACPYCKVRRAVPGVPLMADLPSARVVPSGQAFGTVGVDYFGPIVVTRMRKTEKRYGCIFTCLCTRAVHIEIAFSLDTDSFIMALRRMIARRGRPRIMYSDNGTNLKSGERELRRSLKEINQIQVSDSMTQEDINWQFLPPASPHFGGVYERLVRSAKRAINAIIGRHTVNDECLQTIITEVEGLLNSRPITHISSHPDDLQALTPNHFLLGHGPVNLPPGIFDDGDLCRRRWRHTQRVIDHFWRRWRREYLPTLTERKKWREETTNLRVGELVLIIEDEEPRGNWPLARVVRVMPSEDGRVRAAEVKTAHGKYVRPTVRLCRLELDKVN